MTVAILFAWVIVAGNSHNGFGRDWRPMGEFHSMAACTDAMRALGLNREKARCVSKGLIEKAKP